MPHRRTEVCITIDTEFSIAGAFADYGRYQPLAERIVDCPVNGRSEGLGFILETFERFGIKGTFFVEALNYHYFGDAPMSAVCGRLLAAKQDVQLHIHPCWTAFDGAEAPVRNHDDSCAGRTLEDMKDLISRGLEAFRRWGMARPVALRTGNLVADRVTYEAMSACGLRVASNVGLGVVRLPEEDLQIASGRTVIHQVVEVPVTTFRAYTFLGRSQLRPLQVTACSWAEIEHVLQAARRHGLEQVIIITHPFEYVRTKSFRYESLGVNWVNQRRLRQLCKFLHENDQEFEAVTFGGRADAWAASEPQAEILLDGNLILAIGRTAENGLLHRYWGR